MKLCWRSVLINFILAHSHSKNKIWAPSKKHISHPIDLKFCINKYPHFLLISFLDNNRILSSCWVQTSFFNLSQFNHWTFLYQWLKFSKLKLWLVLKVSCTNKSKCLWSSFNVFRTFNSSVMRWSGDDNKLGKFQLENRVWV